MAAKSSPDTDPSNAFGEGVQPSRPQDAFGLESQKFVVSSSFEVTKRFTPGQILMISSIGVATVAGLFVSQENNSVTLPLKRLAKHGVGVVACGRDLNNQQDAITEALKRHDEVSLDVAELSQKTLEAPTTHVTVSDRNASYSKDLTDPARLVCKYDSGKKRFIGIHAKTTGQRDVEDTFDPEVSAVNDNFEFRDSEDYIIPESGVSYVTRKLHVPAVSKDGYFSSGLVDERGKHFALPGYIN